MVILVVHGVAQVVAAVIRLGDHRHLCVVPSDTRHLHLAQSLLIGLQMNSQLFGLIRCGGLQRSGLIGHIYIPFLIALAK